MDQTQEQSNNRPWLFKKGQPSANPGGRPKGSKSLKTRAKEYLQGLSDKEAIEYFEGINKLDVWKMAEGNAETKSEVKVESLDGFTPEELAEAKKILVNRIKNNPITPESGTGTQSESVGPAKED